MKTSEKVTHTPGPWQNAQLIIEGCNGRLSICDVHDHSSTSEVHTLDEAEANARIIAAAPELLNALEGAQEELRLIRLKDTSAVYDPTIRIRIDLAIRKAKGEV